MAMAMFQLSPFRRLIRRAASTAARAPSRSLRVQHASQVRLHEGVLVSDLLRGLCGGFQVSPGGGDVPGF
jgi:hypothetical protein